MCNVATLALFTTVQYCIGIHRCKVDASRGGYALARANSVEFHVEPNAEYTLFSDAREPSSVNISLLQWNGDSVLVRPPQSPQSWLDPWLLAVFKEEATIKTGDADSFTVSSVLQKAASDETISYGLCPKSNSLSEKTWYMLSFFLTLPLSRTRTQIWRKVTVSIAWPLLVYPLVAAWRQPNSAYLIILDTLLVSDIFFWAGFGMAGFELADVSGFPASSSIFIVIAFLSCLSLTVHLWHRHLAILTILGFLSPLWSMFYWTPLALAYGVVRRHSNYI